MYIQIESFMEDTLSKFLTGFRENLSTQHFNQYVWKITVAKVVLFVPCLWICQMPLTQPFRWKLKVCNYADFNSSGNTLEKVRQTLKVRLSNSHKMVLWKLYGAQLGICNLLILARIRRARHSILILKWKTAVRRKF